MSVAKRDKIRYHPPILKSLKLNRFYAAVFWTKKNKSDHRYYLLPGMARCNRRKNTVFLRWSIVVGAIISAMFAFLLYIANRF